MKCRDLHSLEKAPPCRVYLILDRENEVLPQILHKIPEKPLLFDGEGLQFEQVLSEAETMPMLSPQKVLLIRSIDCLKDSDLEGLKSIVSNLPSWLYLVLVGPLHANSSLVKKVDAVGLVYQPQEEKSWEKERRLTEWLVRAAADEGVRFQEAHALMLVRQTGGESRLLKQELDKLIAFAGETAEITEQALRALSVRMPQETIWQLGDALLAGNKAQALALGRLLYDEGHSLFALIATLRHVISQGLDILSAYQRGGAHAVSEAIPYLKGNWLDKKIEAVRQYGAARLKRAITLLFESEVAAKNSTTHELLHLELLLIQLMR